MKLPKKLESEPALAARVREALAKDARSLWARGTLPVAHITASPGFIAALRRARVQRRVRQGLEAIEKLLANEQHGLHALEARGNAHAARVSRLLLLGPAGSERFYRDAEALVQRHAARVLALRLDESFAEVVRAVLGPGAVAKALLVDDKDGVADVLAALAQEP